MTQYMLHDEIEITPGDALPAGKLEMHPGKWRSSSSAELLLIAELDDSHLMNCVRWVQRTFGRPVPRENGYWHAKAKELQIELKRRGYR